MKEVFKKTANGLIPASDGAQRLFDKIKIGEQGVFEIVRKRNYGNLTRFFKLRDVTFEIQDHFDNDELWRKHLIMIAGYYDEVVIFNPNTEETVVQFWPKSISFEEMEEQEFQLFFKRVITGFLNRYGNGLTETEILSVIGFD